VIQGDQGPFGFLRAAAVHGAALPGTSHPPVPPVPSVPPSPRPGRSRATVLVPWIRGFKIAENMSPRPQDRLFSTFNYFNDVNGQVNRRLGNTFQDMKVYRQIYGFEKTFLNGDASFGLRVPVNTITADSPIRGLGNTGTSFGNITAFTKFIVWKDATAANLVSTGFAVTAPSGPTAFGGAPYSVGFRDVQIQPFVGYFFSKDRWYLQGFEAIDVPTDSRDVTMFYSDVGVGYFVYRSPDRGALLKAIAPTFETHLNVPLNHQGSFRVGDPASTATILDFTFGVNFFVGERGALSVGYVQPVTAPQPFSYEWSLLFNYFFGRTASSRARMSAPVVGN
jgi:hypothetical protein